MKDMKLLLENWREFSEVANREHESRKRIYESYTSDPRHVMYLFDGFGFINEDSGKIIPLKADFNVVLKEWEDGNLSDDIFFTNAEKSFEHEMELFEEAFGSSKGKMKKAIAASEKEDGVVDKGTAKYKVREKLYTVAGAAFGKAIALSNSVLKKINGMIGKIVEWASDPEREQKLAPKLINKLFSMASGIAKVGKWVLGITKKLFKVYGHPYFRIGALVIGAIMVAIAFTSGTGFMAAAAGYPAWAAKRAVGPQIVKGVVTLGKLALTEEDDLGSDLLLEVFDLSADILGTAADLLATAHEDSGISVDTFLSHASEETAGTFVDGEQVQDSFSGINVAVAKQSNESLSQAHRSLETLLNVANKESDMSIYAHAGPEIQQIIESAVASAEMMCKADPAACAGNARFLKEIEVLNVSVIESEHTSLRATKVVEKLGKEVLEKMGGTDRDLAVTTAKGIVRGGEDYGGETAKALKTAAKAGHAKAGGLEAAKALKTADTSGAGWKSKVASSGRKIARLRRSQLEETHVLDDITIDRIVEKIIKRIS